MLAGLTTGSVQAAGAAAVSPFANRTIKQLTTDHQTGETNLVTNTLAHAALGALEAKVTGNNAAAGAMAGASSELAAPLIAKALYGTDDPQQLTEVQKQNIVNLSSLAGAMGAGIANGNGSGTEVLTSANQGAEIGKRAVENNYLSIADVQNFIRELSKAQKEGRDTKPILEKYKGIGEENRQQLIACKGNVACETAHLHEMNTGAEELERNLGFFSRMTVYYPNDLNTANRIALSNLVESENAESFSKLSDTTKFGLNAMEAGTAIGLGAAAGSAKVGFSNVKSLISGKNKAYPTSGMDGYKRINVGDEDYPSTNNISRSLLRTELAFKDAGILDNNGFLTQNAIERAKVLKLKDGYIRNPEIIRVLTKDGSRIEDWEKMTTESIKLPNGQFNQIHFYKNSKTGRIDYETKDFKVKGEVNDFKFKMEENKR